MQGIDQKIILFFQSLRCEGLTHLFSVFIPLFLVRGVSDFCYGVIKNFVHRPRPFLTVKGLVPLITPHGFSCPSGHATIAMAMAVVLAHHFPKARGLVYTLAVLIGASRVYFGVHYLSDVFAGFVLGAVVGCLCIILERMILSVNQAHINCLYTAYYLVVV